MSAVLLAPHNDDETLFASFLCMWHQPHVVVCFKSVVQRSLYGIDAMTRENETTQALAYFGLERDWEQWQFPDDDVDNVEKFFYDVTALEKHYDLCIAPAVEKGGTTQHNLVGSAALLSFGVERVIAYTTYVNGGHRSTGQEVEFKPEWIALKLRALAEYRSQSETPSHVHFMESLREYTA